MTKYVGLGGGVLEKIPWQDCFKPKTLSSILVSHHVLLFAKAKTLVYP